MQIENHNLYKYTFILAIFLLSIYIGVHINFFNNDDWVHYKTVERFLGGDFSLHPYIGSTFYTQGILALIFSKIFGISRLPVLTILISTLNVFIFYKILNLLSPRNLFLKTIGTFSFAINPLYLYSSIGFMTENYVILFMLSAIYSLIKFKASGKLPDLLFSKLFIILGFFVKQYMLFLAFSTIVYLAIKQKWRYLAIYSTLTIILILLYTFAFPKNDVLSGQALSFERSFDILDYSLPLLLTIFLYLCFFTLPLSLIFGFKIKGNKILSFVIFAVILLINLKVLNAEDFPSISNVFTRKGLFPDIDGNKSHWAGYYKFFTYTFYLSVVTSSLVITKLILSAKRIFNGNKFTAISFFTYLALCMAIPVFYDRYLLPLLILWILILYKSSVNTHISKILVYAGLIWIVVYGFFNYLFISDFIVRNIAIENTAQDLINSGVNAKYILANRAWDNYYEVSENDARYIFSYDNPSSFDVYEGAIPEKTIVIDFPFNIFVSKEIFLYIIEE